MAARRVITRAIVPEDLVELAELLELHVALDVAAEIDRIALARDPAADLPQRIAALVREPRERACLRERRVGARLEPGAPHEILDGLERTRTPRIDDPLPLADLDPAHPPQPHPHGKPKIILR